MRTVRAQQVTLRQKIFLRDLWWKRTKLETATTKTAFVPPLRLHPQSRVLISCCFRPKQRQRSRGSKQMTIKLSNKHHHPATIPNDDCGRARRESESGGSRIVSSHFDAKLKTRQKNHPPLKMERGEKVERGCDVKHANAAFMPWLSFVSLVVILITFIKLDLELNSQTCRALKLQPALFLSEP